MHLLLNVILLLLKAFGYRQKKRKTILMNIYFLLILSFQNKKFQEILKFPPFPSNNSLFVSYSLFGFSRKSLFGFSRKNLVGFSRKRLIPLLPWLRRRASLLLSIFSIFQCHFWLGTINLCFFYQTQDLSFISKYVQPAPAGMTLCQNHFWSMPALRSCCDMY